MAQRVVHAPGPFPEGYLHGWLWSHPGWNERIQLHILRRLCVRRHASGIIDPQPAPAKRNAYSDFLLRQNVDRTDHQQVITLHGIAPEPTKSAHGACFMCGQNDICVFFFFFKFWVCICGGVSSLFFVGPEAQSEKLGE